MRRSCFLLLSVMLGSAFTGCGSGRNPYPDIPPNEVVPGAALIRYQQMEMVGFIHFTVNTFTDREWGFGDENPEIFNPSQLNTEQWVLTAKAAGMKQLILTAKHHDGFCLWPSEYTEHDVASSPYKNGRGDIVREFTDACRKHGLKVGLYLSPWDRNHPDYARPAYITYYRNQLRELLTNYGEINEIWFDGANGGSGYYGGANETRRIDKLTYYDWENTIRLVKELQPGIKIFSDAGPDIHWIGNEHGHAGETFWSTINTDHLIIGDSDRDYLNTGDPGGNEWIVGQCDVSIRPGWFYHEKEDDEVKTPQELLDIYYKSVGRNCVLLLNLPPDQRGLIHENDVASLKAFRQILDETFALDLAHLRPASASDTRHKSDQFAAGNVTDGRQDTYWACNDGVTEASLTINLGEAVLFDRVLIREPIRFGQRISRFQVLVQEEGDWKNVADETTIGYQRILRIDPVHAGKLRLKILEANNTPALSNISIFKASEKEGK